VLYQMESMKTFYPLGMRGIHDSPMVGVKTISEKQNALNRVIMDQRALLDKHVAPAATVPQIFVPYKEVLQVYKAGIELPSDITLVWPDDNYGYIRHFADTVEVKRSGRSGVYYHLSYLGTPLSYLWLCTTPPALISEELTRAYDHGADRFWIFNVGDIKPAEVDITFAMDLAWDTKGIRTLTQKEYLTQFAAQSFGPDHASEIGEVLDIYYKLNFERRPEQLQYYLPKETPHDSDLSAAAVFARIASMDDLLKKLDAVTARIPKAQTESFYELVEYPVRSSALANRRFFDIEAYHRESAKNANLAGFYAGRARKEDAAITQLTARYNNNKWRGIMAEEPADQQWKSFRLAAPVLPPATSVRREDPPATPAPVDEVIHVEAETVQASGWQLIAGLGRGAGSMRASTPNTPLTTPVVVPHDGSWCLNTYVIPTFPTDNSTTWELHVVVDNNQAQTLKYTHEPTTSQWSQGVLDNRLAQSFPVMLPAGVHTVTILSPQPDLILDGYDLIPQVNSACN